MVPKKTAPNGDHPTESEADTNERAVWTLLGLVVLIVGVHIVAPERAPPIGLPAAILTAITTLLVAKDSGHGGDG